VKRTRLAAESIRPRKPAVAVRSSLPRRGGQAGRSAYPVAPWKAEAAAGDSRSARTGWPRRCRRRPSK
jgi:hypothetical protein